MAGFDKIVYGLLIGKINGLASGVSSAVVDNVAKTITFTFLNGSQTVMTFDQPKGIDNIVVNPVNDHLIINYGDGTFDDVGKLPSTVVVLDPDPTNTLTLTPNGYYCAGANIAVDPTTDNLLEQNANPLYPGLIVKHDVDKVDVDQGIANAGKALVIDAAGFVTVGAAGVDVSSKTDNDVQNLTGQAVPSEDGIYVHVPIKELQLDSNVLTPDSTGMINIEPSADPGNIFQFKADGPFVPSVPTKISTKTGNDIIEETTVGLEGIYANIPVKEIKVDGTALVPDATGSVDITLSADTGNIIENRTDGLFAEIPIDPDINNIIQLKTDGLFVAASPIKISAKTDNILESIATAPDDGLYVPPVDNDADDLTYDVLFDATAVEATPYHGDSDKETSTEYLYNQFAIVIPKIMDAIEDIFNLASNMEYETYDTYAELAAIDQTLITNKIMIYLVKQDVNYPRTDGAADYYSTVYLMIPKTDPSQNLIEFVAKLNMSEKLLEYAITEAIKRAIYIDLPPHYEIATAGDAGAKLVVADGTLSDPNTEIEESNVTPIMPTGTTVNVGDYVVYVPNGHSNVTKFVKRDEVDVPTISKFLEDSSGNLTYAGNPLAISNTEYIALADYDLLPASKLTDNKQYWIN